MNSAIRSIALGITALSFSASVHASNTSAYFAEQVVNNNINVDEVKNAVEGWGAGLLQISKDFRSGGTSKATRTASKIIDSAYGYNMGAVLFKPTLTSGEQTFRTTREGALSYFVGGNKKFAADSGFALKNWVKFEYDKAAVYINGDLAITMGNVILTDSSGKTTKVDKTWGFKKDENGKLRIVLHHSSLPFSNTP